MDKAYSRVVQANCMSELVYVIDGLATMDFPKYRHKELSKLYAEAFNAPELSYTEFCDYLFQERPIMFWYLIDDVIVSSATGIIYPSPLHGGREWMQIENVCTLEGQQGNGYATKLINRLVDIAKQEDCYKVNLSCSNNNLKFYEKLGFKIHEHTMRIDLED